MNLLDQTKTKMATAIEHLKTELKGLRTGRANPALLDGISIEVYGTQMRLKDIANITTPESRMILVTPFDAQHANAIGKAIERANLGMVPIVDSNVIRLKVPPMDESVRKEMIKLCGKKCEEAKVSIRNIRRDSNESARRQKSEGEMAEDVSKKLEKQIQELTDKSCKDADDLASKKEKEIATI